MTTHETIQERLGVRWDGNLKACPLDSPLGTRETLALLLAELHLNVGAEIGVESGAYSKLLLEANPHLKLYCVDAWRPYRGYKDHVTPEKFQRFKAETKAALQPFGRRFETVEKFSMEAVTDFPAGSLDFVYIDGNHGFDWVMQDLIEWGKRVRKGGIIAGHDYIRRPDDSVHVVQAVQAYTYTHKMYPWYLVGGSTKEVRSYVLVKP